jgi:hypothetical protein
MGTATWASSESAIPFEKFLDELMGRGLVNPGVAASYKVVCLEVLRAVFGPDWGRVDVTTLDVDHLLEAFQRRRGHQLPPKGVARYRTQLSEVFQLFRQFVHPEVPDVPPDLPSPSPPDRLTGPPAAPVSPTRRGERKKVRRMPSPPPSRPDTSESLIYPFPLRPGLVISISLPTDLTTDESKRLARFLDALTVDAGAAVVAGTNGHRTAQDRAPRRRA